jgi:diaminopimelate epimerase
VVSDVGDKYKMTVFNSNGSTAANCGNGLRCVAAYLYLTKKLGNIFKVCTDSGDKEVVVE